MQCFFLQVNPPNCAQYRLIKPATEQSLEGQYDIPFLFCQDKKAVAESKRMADVGMQTLLHPIPHFKDPQYDWNEWELRRKALRLVSSNLPSRQTLSINL